MNWLVLDNHVSHTYGISPMKVQNYLRPFPHQENGSSVNRLGLAEFKSASVLSLHSSTLT